MDWTKDVMVVIGAILPVALSFGLYWWCHKRSRSGFLQSTPSSPGLPITTELLPVPHPTPVPTILHRHSVDRFVGSLVSRTPDPSFA